MELTDLWRARTAPGHGTSVEEFFGNRQQPKAERYFAHPDLCQYDMKEPGQEELYWKNA